MCSLFSAMFSFYAYFSCIIYCISNFVSAIHREKATYIQASFLIPDDLNLTGWQAVLYGVFQVPVTASWIPHSRTYYLQAEAFPHETSVPGSGDVCL